MPTRTKWIGKRPIYTLLSRIVMARPRNSYGLFGANRGTRPSVDGLVSVDGLASPTK